MGERIETASQSVQMGPGWGLNLTAQRRQYMLRCLLLQAATPFLALGGRYLPQSVAARSLGLLTAIPWLVPRWLEWSDRDITPAHAKESAMRSPQATTPAVTSTSAHTHPQQQAQPPIALALTLHSACAGLGTPGCGWGNSPALVSPFLGELRVAAPSSPTTAEAVVHSVRTRGEIASTGMGAFPQHHIQPQILSSHSDKARQADNLSALKAKVTDERTLAGAGGEEAGFPLRIRPQILPSHWGTAWQADNLSAPDSKATNKQIMPGAGGGKAGSPLVSGRSYGPMPLRLPKMAPLWGPLGGFRGLTPGTSPATFYRIMIPVAPGHRTKQAKLLFQSSPEAVDTSEMPPLPEHKLHGGPETVASGPVSPQGLSLVLETIRHTMKREVAAAIREREEEAQALASNHPSGPDMTVAENLVSDNIVRLFMQKMRKLAEEERFRLGLLR